ncbi:MAG: hypothetical protein ACHP84_20400 [Caulobacterales bacterium]
MFGKEGGPSHPKAHAAALLKVGAQLRALAGFERRVRSRRRNALQAVYELTLNRLGQFDGVLSASARPMTGLGSASGRDPPSPPCRSRPMTHLAQKLLRLVNEFAQCLPVRKLTGRELPVLQRILVAVRRAALLRAAVHG